MRILLTVHRHGIPPVPLIWTITSTRPPLAAAGGSITVSQFLEQVNDIIPLEYEEWGLEDYAVEVRGFECLHFSELGQVLKEDDEVCIRPLQTNDLRVRRISGRHQISTDGKHLIDGVAFGRPYLRRAERPTVRIPPRKRRRLIYDENEDEDIDQGQAANDRQIVLRAGFDDADESHEADETDDEDFAPEDEDLGPEIEDLQDELHAGANESALAVLGSEVPAVRRSTRRKARRSHEGLGLLELTDGNDQLTFGTYDNPLLDKYEQDESALSRPAGRKRKRRSVNLAPDPINGVKQDVRDRHTSPVNESRRSSAGSNKSVHFEDVEPATPATIREFQDSEEEDDDFEPGDIDESDKENAKPPVEAAISSDESPTASESSSGSSSAHSESDETSSSGSFSSDSSSDSDSEPEELSTVASSRRPESSRTSSTASSDSSSDSDSDSESESESETQAKSHKTSVKTTESQKLGGNLVSPAQPPPIKRVPPGQGKRKTQARNQRKRRQRILANLKSEGILGANATLIDLQQYNEGKLSTSSKISDRERLQKVNSADLIDCKKKALLDAIAKEDVDMDSTTNAQEDQLVTVGINDQPPELRGDKGLEDIVPANEVMQQAQTIDAPTAPVVAQEVGEEVTSEKDLVPASDPAQNQTVDHTPSPSSVRKSKLDLSSAKRMLFGSLGLRTPKTKQDESETREKLMKDVRPIKVAQPEKKVETLEEIAADDSWKEKIDLRAVECCHDGIKLSTPPFPFVQRWDPQQRRGYNSGNKQKRKRKKRMRTNSSYYEDDSFQDSRGKKTRFEEYVPSGGKVKYSNTDGTEDLQEDDYQHDSFDQSIQDSQAVNEQLLRESGEISAISPSRSGDLAEDLLDIPDLPEDPNECLSLTREAIKEGTVIAFKQLEMSAETNWQPKISDYRTAIIDGVSHEGTLQMTPAKRDRPEREVKYDESTGERLYSKFEMPGYDDGHDSDKLEISFDELINPVLLRDVPNDSNQEDGQHDHVQAPKDGGPMEANEVLDGNSVHLDGAADDPIEPSKENREEISELIKEAGWRSSVRSEVNGDLYSPEPPGPQEKKDNHDDTTLVDAPSPRFNGFSSSPIINVRSSPPVADAPSPKHLLASGTEIAESIPRQDPDPQSAVPESKSVIEYPTLPQIGDDSELLQDEAQQRSDPPFEHTSLSQDLISNSMNHSPAQSTRSRTKVSQEKSSPMPSNPLNNATDSEDEFPEVFSQAWETRMSQEVDIKPEFSQESMLSPLSWRRSKLSSQRESNRSWKPDGNWSAFEEEGQSREIEEEEEDDEGLEDDTANTPRPSQQPPKSSGIVDLTLSSDSVEDMSQQQAMKEEEKEEEEEDSSYKLPKGPGWVKKKTSPKKSREQRGSVSVKANIEKAKTKRK